jgi:phosphoenolpyruvate synthase/pyruvate phosphate dikinase
MKKSVYQFDSKSVPSLEEVGGKAQSLIVMTKEGFNVPDGLVLCVSFFESWFKKVEKSRSWKTFLSSTEKSLKKHCDAVKKSCRSLKFTASQKNILRDALKKFSKNALFAVRSSSPEEDLEGTSFAGGYETSLGIAVKDLEVAILDSFISVYDERIVKYKMQHGMKTDQPRIAVIVQEQIASEVSGVAFSLNPQNNCYDEAVITSSFGLGEMIVSGQVTPDTFVVDKVKKEIISKKISHKDEEMVIRDLSTPSYRQIGRDRKVVKRKVVHAKLASLNESQVKAVSKLVSDVEKYFDKPMDIEWAYSEKKLYLLQARPITAFLILPPEMISKPGAQKYLYQDALLMEQGIQEPMSILGIDMYNDIVKVMMGPRMGKLFTDPNAGIVFCGHGKAYMNASNTIKAFGKRGLNGMMGSFDVPTGKIMANIDYDEYLPKKTPPALRGLVFKMLPLLLQPVFGFVRVYFRPKKVLKNYKLTMEKDLQAIDDIDFESQSFREVYTQALDILIDHMLSIYDVLLGPLYSRWRLGKIFKGHNVDDLLVKLQMNLPGNPTSKMGHDLYALAKFPEIQKCKSAKEFARKIKTEKFSAKFMDAFNQYMKEFGFRCIREIDLGTPRPYEDLEQFFKQLSLIHVSKRDEDSLLVKAEQDQKKASRKLKRIAKKLGKEKALEYHAGMIRDLAGYREVPKYVMVKIIDLIRRKGLELGREWQSKGRLDDAEDVFSLKVSELFAAEKNRKKLQSLVESNTVYTRKVSKQKDWPRVVDSRGKIFRVPHEKNADSIIGDAISPGVIRGRVKVLHDPYEKPLKKGEILVTRATDPGWTPLFMNAGAVVLEVGGALQHGAVIAREYGIPCVSGIDRAATRFKDGQLIEVNGSDGTVRILKKA